MTNPMDYTMEQEIAERPEGFGGPNLSPIGLELVPRKLADGAYALMANVPPKDNNGVLFGSRAALAIDAGITPAVGAQIVRRASDLADVPLRYLVNTTYHGDHTFGAVSFGDDITMVTSRANRDNMTDLEREKTIRAPNLFGDDAELEAVTRWRLPDLVFEGYAEIDLGGLRVELHHFGPGNGPGDTIVYVPSAATAWTGNFVTMAGSPHMLLQGGPEPYIRSVQAMRAALPGLRTIVPGHGPMGDGQRALVALVDYLERLRDEVSAAFSAGRSVEETYDLCTDPWADGLEPELTEALAAYGLPRGPVIDGFTTVSRDLHRLNILTTYRVYAHLSAPK